MPFLEEQVYEVLEALPPEKDRQVAWYAANGFEARNALTAQGVHALQQQYCEPLRCMSCRIGQWIVGTYKES